MVMGMDNEVQEEEKMRRETMETEDAGEFGAVRQSWELGQACRAVFLDAEYEGTIVNKNLGNNSVTFRFRGYNNEEEVRVMDLMESKGAEAV
jgi:hypothetical protein